MIFLYILFAVLFLLAAVLILPVRIAFRLVDDRFTVSVLILGIRYMLYPKKKPHKPAKVKKKKENEPSGMPDRKSTAGEIREILRVALPRIPRVFGAIDVPKFRLHLRISAENPAKCAELFGAACAAFGMIWQHLDRIFAIRRPRIDIEPDFEGKKTELLLFADVRTCVLKILIAALPILASYLKRKIQLSGGKTK